MKTHSLRESRHLFEGNKSVKDRTEKGNPARIRAMIHLKTDNRDGGMGLVQERRRGVRLPQAHPRGLEPTYLLQIPNWLLA